MDESVVGGVAEGYESPLGKSYAGKRIVVAPEAVKVAVEVQVTPDYAVTALFPQSNQTLKEVGAAIRPPAPAAAMSSAKMSHAERVERLAAAAERIRKL